MCSKLVIKLVMSELGYKCGTRGRHDMWLTIPMRFCEAIKEGPRYCHKKKIFKNMECFSVDKPF